MVTDGQEQAQVNAEGQEQSAVTLVKTPEGQPIGAVEQKRDVVVTYDVDGVLIDGMHIPQIVPQIDEIPKAKEKEKYNFFLIGRMIEQIKSTDRKLPLLEIEVLPVVPKSVYKDLIRKGWLEEKTVFLSRDGKSQGGGRNICWLSPMGIAIFELMVAELEKIKEMQEIQTMLMQKEKEEKAG